MVGQGDFVIAQFAGLGIKSAAPHFGTERAGAFAGLGQAVSRFHHGAFGKIKGNAVPGAVFGQGRGIKPVAGVYGDGAKVIVFMGKHLV